MIGTRNRIVTWPMISSDFLREFKAHSGSLAVNKNTAWMPTALVSEADDAFSLRLEVPGVSVDSLDVDLDGEYLTVSGDRERSLDDETGKVLISEIAWGGFRRRFRFGTQMDPEGVIASYKNGILEITVPKKQEARPRRIPVTT